jgi:hypothetical protein
VRRGARCGRSRTGRPCTGPDGEEDLGEEKDAFAGEDVSNLPGGGERKKENRKELHETEQAKDKRRVGALIEFQSMAAV